MAGITKILIVDDEPDVCDVVSIVLEESGYEVTVLNRGETVVDVVKNEGIDLVVLDLGLPDIDGLTLTRNIKSTASVGVIILSGRGETMERIVGLEVGADDYVSKPFEPRELLARVRSVLRRISVQTEDENAETEALVFEGWKLDLVVRSLTSPQGENVTLSSGEFNLLRAFVEHPNRVLSRDQLLDFTHSHDAPAFDRSVDVQIARLRKKIEPGPDSPKFIKTVRNAGYIFSVKVTNK